MHHERHDLLHLARLAVQIARTPFRDYASTFAPKRYTQPSRLACLCLKAYLPVDYRGTEALLVGAQQLQEALGLRTAPDHSTRWWFGRHKVKPRLLADAGDDAEANHCWWREDLGVESIIPPIAGRPARGLTRRPYRRQLPLAFPHTAYGQRWKIETRISVVKRWFGGALTTRRYWQQVKQTLLRGVTYNLYRAVQLGLLIHLVSQRFVKAAA